MAKRPTPKKRLSRDRSKRRYQSFARKVKNSILNRVNLTVCPQCREKKLLHMACPICGTYKGRQIIDMDKGAEKVTKIKA